MKTKHLIIALLIASTASMAHAQTKKKRFPLLFPAGVLGTTVLGVIAYEKSLAAQKRQGRELDGSPSPSATEETKPDGDVSVETPGYESPDMDDDSLTFKSNPSPLRRALNDERVSNGEPPDPDDCDAHHIVPKNDTRKGVREQAMAARAALHECIDLDSVENGVFLPRKREGSAKCSGPHHYSLHTASTYQQIATQLLDAREAEGCAGVVKTLKSIKQGLENANFPN